MGDNRTTINVILFRMNQIRYELLTGNADAVRLHGEITNITQEVDDMYIGEEMAKARLFKELLELKQMVKTFT